MPTTSSWPHDPTPTSSRHSALYSNRNRTPRSRRSSRTGEVELASTESGRRDALRALTSRRWSVRGTHGSPRIRSESCSPTFYNDRVAPEGYNEQYGRSIPLGVEDQSRRTHPASRTRP
jgi:hypothetical protein